jgi:hypothetical protein
MIKRELYRHRQIGWTMILSAAAPIVLLALLLPHASPKFGALPAYTRQLWIVPAVIIGLVTLVFSSLRVIVTTELLEISFGPGFIKRRWPVADIEATALIRTSVANGWGIRRRDGSMLYNVSGFDAVAITLKEGRLVMVGSDDAAQLKRAIEGARARH